MSQRLSNVKVGDLVRVFTFDGATFSPNSYEFLRHGGPIKFGHPGVIFDDDGLGDEVLPLNLDKDGFEITGVYLGEQEMRASRRHPKQRPEPYIALNHPTFTANPQKVDDSYVSLVVPKRLIRRFQILEPTYSSPVLPLEEISRLLSPAS